MKSAEVQGSANELVAYILQHPESVDELALLVRQLLKDVNNDPATVRDLGKLIASALRDPLVQAAAGTMVSLLSEDEEVFEACSKLSSKVRRKNMCCFDIFENYYLPDCLDSFLLYAYCTHHYFSYYWSTTTQAVNTLEMTRATSKLLTDASASVLSAPEIMNQSQQFVVDIFSDELIHREGGDAIVATAQQAAKNSFYKGLGMSIIAASCILIQIVTAPF